MSAVALTLDGVRIALGARALVPPLTITIAPGACVTVMGPSGSGKSTLLAYLAGTMAPAFTATGRVLLGARDVTHAPPQSRRMGMLFQDDLLFPHLSVGGNLAFALPPAIRDRAERRARVAAALAEANLEGYEERDPATLSGGQRARVALMRTLLAAPEALLLDEPFGKLDAQLRDGMRRFLFDHARERGLPILLVTHDPSDAEAAGGRIITLK